MFTAVVVRVWLWVNDAAAFDESQCVVAVLSELGLVSVGSARNAHGCFLCGSILRTSLSLSQEIHKDLEKNNPPENFEVDGMATLTINKDSEIAQPKKMVQRFKETGHLVFYWIVES